MKNLFCFAFLTLAACSGNDGPAAHDDALIGGQVETRFPGVGYLVARLDEGPHAGAVIKPYCAATLVAPTAVITTASCVSKDVAKVTIVGVGFGAVDSGPIYEVTGRPFPEWIKEDAIWVGQDPEGAPIVAVTAAQDVALVTLKSPVTGITPLKINSAPIAPSTPALAIGYGRVVAGNRDEAHDALEGRIADSTYYPGTRKSIAMNIAIALNQIHAYPKENDPTSGGVCFGDHGAPLILADASVAGIFGEFADDALTASQVDGEPLCSPKTGGFFVNLRFGGIPAFLRNRLAALPQGEVAR